MAEGALFSVAEGVIGKAGDLALYEIRKDALLTQRENEREKILKFSDRLN